MIFDLHITHKEALSLIKRSAEPGEDCYFHWWFRDQIKEQIPDFSYHKYTVKIYVADSAEFLSPVFRIKVTERI